MVLTKTATIIAPVPTTIIVAKDISTTRDQKTSSAASTGIAAAATTTQIKEKSLRSWRSPSTLCMIGAAVALKATIVALTWQFGAAAVAQQGAAFFIPGLKALAFALEPFFMWVILPMLSTAVVTALSVAVTLWIVSKLFNMLKERAMSMAESLPFSGTIKSLIGSLTVSDEPSSTCEEPLAIDIPKPLEIKLWSPPKPEMPANDDVAAVEEPSLFDWFFNPEGIEETPCSADDSNDVFSA